MMWKQLLLVAWLSTLGVCRSPAVQDLSLDQLDNEDLTITRSKRQSAGDTGGTRKDKCEFGTNDDLHTCDWENGKFQQLMWVASKGQNSNWLGGPTTDNTFGDSFGGYAFIETSRVKSSFQSAGFESAMLISSKLDPTLPEGICLQFWYFIKGLSPDRLRVLLHPLTDIELMNDTIDVVYDGSEDRVLWEAMDQTQNNYLEANVLYTMDKPYKLILEGIPVAEGNPTRGSRGFIAVDDLNLAEGTACKAFCTFEGGLCEWTQDTEDDFDWTLTRGSNNPSTGAYRDRPSFTNPVLPGGFVQIETEWPRRPGDTARLMSTEFSSTDAENPLCLRFWTHMFGNGIGTLRVIIMDTSTDEDIIIWSLTGEAGNEWYQGQVPIASLNTFKIVFEGEVGSNSLGNIGLDDITITQGACPSAPQVAAGNPGDCTFELDECGWTNPATVDRVDESDWVRILAVNSRIPDNDHTKGTPKGYYMALPLRENVRRLGDRAWLVSSTVKRSDDPLCISFWYYMFEQFIDQTGPSLGTLSVLMMTLDDKGNMESAKPVWSLKNHQGPTWINGQVSVRNTKDFAIVFEGMWGSVVKSGYMAIDDITFYNGECSIQPKKAKTTSGDCDFQRNSCFYTNTTTDPNFTWSLASIGRRPANHQDKTFGGPVGYVFFDVFNQNGKSQTLDKCSPSMPSTSDNRDVCLTFWFAGFGSGSSTILAIIRKDAPLEEGDKPGDPEKLWESTAELSGSTSSRPTWSFGQVSVAAGSDYIVCFQGRAKNGGYALDDIRIADGPCDMRPATATPSLDSDSDTEE